jgi:hypothetical protein
VHTSSSGPCRPCPLVRTTALGPQRKTPTAAVRTRKGIGTVPRRLPTFRRASKTTRKPNIWRGHQARPVIGFPIGNSSSQDFHDRIPPWSPNGIRPHSLTRVVCGLSLRALRTMAIRSCGDYRPRWAGRANPHASNGRQVARSASFWPAGVAAPPEIRRQWKDISARSVPHALTCPPTPA